MCSNLRNKNVKYVLTNTILLILQLKSLLQQQFFLRHPRCDVSATLPSLSEQPYDFTMHYNGHSESTYVVVKVTH